MARVHDADICDRIRKLEKEVERLKARPNHCGHWHYTPFYHPPYIYGGNTWTGTGTITTSDTATGGWGTTSVTATLK